MAHTGTSRADIDDFLAQRTLAVVGASRNGRKFGNVVSRELTAKGYRIFEVNAHAGDGASRAQYADLASLPEPVGGAVVVVPPSQTEKVVRDAAASGVPRLWIQQGASSDEAIRFCREHDIRVVAGECILMFAEPVGSIHRVHRWLWRLFGRLPR